MKNEIVNTEKLTRDDPKLTFFAMQPHPGAAIEEMERNGQKQLIASSVLPIKCEQANIGAEALEIAGVRFGRPVDDDPLFRAVELPEGWQFEASESVFWSHLLDERGNVRAHIFYKAAWYDRKASYLVKHRFYATYRPADPAVEWCDAVEWVGCVMDSSDRLVWQTPPRPADYDGKDALRQEAQAWLSEHYPDWQKLDAYWDVEITGDGKAS